MIAFAIGVVALALFIIAWILVHIMQVIENAFLWHKDWIKFEKKYKRRIFELQTDLEAEKTRNCDLQLRLDIASGKIKLKNSRNETQKVPATTFSE